MKTSRLTKVLDLGAGHGRGATFFASNGIEVEALDYAVISEIKMVLKPKGLNLFSARNDNESSCRRGVELDKKIHM